MAVLLANRQFVTHVSTHPWPRDAHGRPIAPAPNSVPAGNNLMPGAAAEQPDGTWTLRLAPEQWPLRQGDKVSAPADGQSWTVDSARLCAVPGCGAADYIAVTATLDPPAVP